MIIFTALKKSQFLAKKHFLPLKNPNVLSGYSISSLYSSFTLAKQSNHPVPYRSFASLNGNLRNEDIEAKKIRLIIPLEDGSERNSITSSEKALELAKEMGLDLVCVAPLSNPPVCKVMDYGRTQYELKKRMKELKEQQKAAEINPAIMKEKEFRFKGLIADHDLNIRAQKAIVALKKGHRVLISVMTNRKQLRKDPDCGNRVMQAVMELTEDYRQEVQEKKVPPGLHGSMMRQCVLKPK